MGESLVMERNKAFAAQANQLANPAKQKPATSDVSLPPYYSICSFCPHQTNIRPPASPTNDLELSWIATACVVVVYQVTVYPYQRYWWRYRSRHFWPSSGGTSPRHSSTHPSIHHRNDKRAQCQEMQQQLADNGVSDGDVVDELVGRYNSFSSFTQAPAGISSPEGFQNEQRRESQHEQRHRSDARTRMNNFKTSVRSALAIMKPRSVGKRVENEKWWRKIQTNAGNLYVEHGFRLLYYILNIEIDVGLNFISNYVRARIQLNS
jgi:hypothetical protein